ncbi:MAG: hypothetical protein U5Q44_01695 [Dehalococcoidia bacterium]|nr:hypothetical protein [Dehalococcoidia bacterium]
MLQGPFAARYRQVAMFDAGACEVREAILLELRLRAQVDDRANPVLTCQALQPLARDVVHHPRARPVHEAGANVAGLRPDGRPGREGSPPRHRSSRTPF